MTKRQTESDYPQPEAEQRRDALLNKLMHTPPQPRPPRNRLPAHEYIVLDGGSTDGTVAIIRENADAISFWRSAPDAGLYDALNEGVRRANGRFVQFVHSDDWLEPDQIERAVAAATKLGWCVYPKVTAVPLATTISMPFSLPSTS